MKYIKKKTHTQKDRIKSFRDLFFLPLILEFKIKKKKKNKAAHTFTYINSFIVYVRYLFFQLCTLMKEMNVFA